MENLPGLGPRLQHPAFGLHRLIRVVTTMSPILCIGGPTHTEGWFEFRDDGALEVESIMVDRVATRTSTARDDKDNALSSAQGTLVCPRREHASVGQLGYLS